MAQMLQRLRLPACQQIRSIGSPFRATAAARHPAYRMFAMATAQPGDYVVVEYTGTSEAGVLWESSKETQKPMEFVIGERRELKGLDRAVVGMEVGASRSVKLEAAEAFGEADPKLVIEAPRPPGMQIAAGDKVTLGGKSAKVVAADGRTVTVDLNHELAGQAMQFDLTLSALTPAARVQRATFGAGCFWGVELAFQRVHGVLSTEVGYSNGEVEDPTYEQVCSGATGHAEVVQVVYDSESAAFEGLLDVFWGRHDPTTLNRQGGDAGTQYRSGIYYHTEEQKAVAEKSMAAAQSRFRDPIVTEVAPIAMYYPAEEYHQQYLSKGGRFSRAQSAAKGCTDPIRCYG